MGIAMLTILWIFQDNLFVFAAAYLAVSLGFYKTLFNAPGTGTSSEIPADEQQEMGLSDGLIRFSIGLDNNIERTYQEMKKCMQEVGIL